MPTLGQGPGAWGPTSAPSCSPPPSMGDQDPSPCVSQRSWLRRAGLALARPPGPLGASGRRGAVTRPELTPQGRPLPSTEGGAGSPPFLSSHEHLPSTQVVFNRGLGFSGRLLLLFKLHKEEFKLEYK